jgi:hypothetical protein
MVDYPKPMDAEFLRSVRRLTSAEGGDLTRRAAVEELNRQRRSEGKPAMDPDDVFNTLLVQDRAQSSQRASDRGEARRITGGLLSTAPRGTTDPDLLASFRQPRPTAAPPVTSPAPPPAAPVTPPAPEPRWYTGTAFEGSPAQLGAARAQESAEATVKEIRDATGKVIPAATKEAKRISAEQRRKLLESTRGSAFEGSRAAEYLRSFTR